jgi:hypothetical protein
MSDHANAASLRKSMEASKDTKRKKRRVPGHPASQTEREMINKKTGDMDGDQ